MEQVTIRGVGDGPIEAAVARTFLERLRGIKATDGSKAVLLQTMSVHTFGLRDEIGVVAVDRSMRVLASRTVRPNRIVWFRGASGILELTAPGPLPQAGTVLEVNRG